MSILETMNAILDGTLEEPVEYLTRYGTDEMSKVLCNLAMEESDMEIIAECDEAIYEVLQLGKNGNRHYMITLFRVLEILTHKHEDIIFKEKQEGKIKA